MITSTTPVQNSLLQLLQHPDMQIMLGDRRATPINQRGMATFTNQQLERLCQISGLGAPGAIMMGSTSMLRNAPFLRWLTQKSMLAGRDDLSVFGVGTGLLPFLTPPCIDRRHPWHRVAVQQRKGYFFTEPLEFILAARKGSVEYIDLLREAREAGSLFQKSGVIIIAALEGPQGVLARWSQCPEDLAVLQPQPSQPSDLAVVTQMIEGMKRCGVQVRDVKGQAGGQPLYSELTFPGTFSGRFNVRHRDLLLNDLPTDKDLVVACNVFPYIQPDGLKVFAAARLAMVPRLGGLLALSGIDIPGMEQTPSNEISHGVLLALGYRLIETVPLMYRGEVIRVYQRPEQEDPFFQSVRQFLGLSEK